MEETDIMKFWDKDYEAKVKADGNDFLLVCTKIYFVRYTPELINKKVLLKFQQQYHQQKPWHRTSKIDEDAKIKLKTDKDRALCCQCKFTDFGNVDGSRQNYINGSGSRVVLRNILIVRDT